LACVAWFAWFFPLLASLPVSQAFVAQQCPFGKRAWNPDRLLSPL
jgi:hypothetical protein